MKKDDPYANDSVGVVLARALRGEMQRMRRFAAGYPLRDVYVPPSPPKRPKAKKRATPRETRP